MIFIFEQPTVKTPVKTIKRIDYDLQAATRLLAL
jgi:hypothetical protein